MVSVTYSYSIPGVYKPSYNLWGPNWLCGFWKDYVKKIAVYRDRLAVQLPDKVGAPVRER